MWLSADVSLTGIFQNPSGVMNRVDLVGWNAPRVEKCGKLLDPYCKSKFSSCIYIDRGPAKFKLIEGTGIFERVWLGLMSGPETDSACPDGYVELGFSWNCL